MPTRKILSFSNLGTYFDIGNMGENNPTNVGSVLYGVTQAETVFTPSVTTIVELRNVLNASRAYKGGVSGTSPASSATITQLGSSVYTTLNTFTGATISTAGTAGGVPFPAAAQHKFFLRGDGTWSKPTFSGARRFANAATAIPGTNTDTLVTTGTLDYVIGTDVTALVANQIAIVTTGYYRMTGSYEMPTGATTDRYAATIRVNGTTEAIGGSCTSVASIVNPQVTVTLLLTSGDIITLGAISGDAQSTVSGSSKTYLEVTFLGIA